MSAQFPYTPDDWRYASPLAFGAGYTIAYRLTADLEVLVDASPRLGGPQRLDYAHQLRSVPPDAVLTTAIALLRDDGWPLDES